MTVRRQGKTLTAEDRILWHRVAHSVKPLAGSVLPDPEDFEEVEPLIEPAPASRPASPPAQQKEPPKPRPTGLDLRTHGKIAKGRLTIDGRIDLHGLTQAEAHQLLLSFLHRANAAGMRHVLVITGKGRSKGGEGVLRRAVPAWLATAPFSGLVGAHAPAGRHHGGEGALYLRLRRHQP